MARLTYHKEERKFMGTQTPKILVVERAELLMPAWQEKFKKQGFKVLIAGDKKAAVKAAVAEHPDVTVVDLPNREGVATIKKVRQNKWANGMPVLFLNSWKDPEIASQYSKGIDDYLAYDWSLEEVVNRVKSKIFAMRAKIN